MVFIYVNKRSWLHPGPIINIALNNCHSLAQIGQETHFFLGTPTDGSQADIPSDLRTFYGLEPLPQFHVHLVKRFQWGPVAHSKPIIQAAIAKALEIAERDDVVLLTRDATHLPFLAKACEHPRISALYEAHDFYYDLSWHADSPSIQDRRQSRFEQQYLPKISGLVCITAPQQALYHRVLPDLPKLTLPLGTRLFGPGNPDARRELRRIVYVGHLHGSKGVSNIISSARLLGPRGISLACWGGSQPQVDRFQKLAAHYNVQQYVEFKPFRPPAELHADLQTQCSIGLVPLQDTFYNRNLTCPGKALDYLSHGIPVLCTRMATTIDCLGSAGIYFRPDDTKQMRQMIKGLLSSPETYAAASARAYERADYLSWPRRAQRLLDFASNL